MCQENCYINYKCCFIVCIVKRCIRSVEIYLFLSVMIELFQYKIMLADSSTGSDLYNCTAEYYYYYCYYYYYYLLANHTTVCHNIHALLHGLFNRLFLYS